jgi:hypothetical protein
LASLLREIFGIDLRPVVNVVIELRAARGEEKEILEAIITG